MCRQMLSKASANYCGTFQLLIFNSEKAVLTTTQLRSVNNFATAEDKHTLPAITMLGWTEAAIKFAASLGLQCNKIVQLMHPEDSNYKPDVPWVVVTVDAEQSQDRFSYQDVSSADLPHWAWMSNELAVDELQMSDGYRVETSTNYLIECEIDEAQSTEMDKDADLLYNSPVWSHWLRFCSRFGKPVFLSCVTQLQQSDAALQAQLFLTYETACFGVKASTIAANLWKVGVAHKTAGYTDPFECNDLVKSMVASARSLEVENISQILEVSTTESYPADQLSRTLNRDIGNIDVEYKDSALVGNDSSSSVKAYQVTIKVPTLSTVQPSHTFEAVSIDMGDCVSSIEERSVKSKCMQNASWHSVMEEVFDKPKRQQILKDSVCQHRDSAMEGSGAASELGKGTGSGVTVYGLIPNNSSDFEDYYTEFITPPQDEFVSEEHLRPGNALQDLAITYFETPEEEAMSRGERLDTSEDTSSWAALISQYFH